MCRKLTKPHILSPVALSPRAHQSNPMPVRLRGAPLQVDVPGGGSTSPIPSSPGKQVGSMEAAASGSVSRRSHLSQPLSPSRRALLQEMYSSRSVRVLTPPPDAFRPLSVVHQVPRNKGKTTALNAYAEQHMRTITARGISWLDDETRIKMLQEHEEATLELKIIALADASSPLEVPARPPISTDPQSGGFEGTPSPGSASGSAPGIPVPSPRTMDATEELFAHLLSRGRTEGEIEALFEALAATQKNGVFSAAALQEGLRRARDNESEFAPLLAIAEELNVPLSPPSRKKEPRSPTSSPTKKVGFQAAEPGTLQRPRKYDTLHVDFS